MLKRLLIRRLLRLMLLPMPEARLYRAYKAELDPTDEQREKMRQNMGVCRYLYNAYLNMNIHLFKMYSRGLLDERQDHFISAINFDKYVNRRLKVLPHLEWIGLCGSKARKKALVNAETAYKNYFSSKRSFPRFKAKYRGAMKLYFPRNNPADWEIERCRVKIPTFGRVRLKERGYLPTDVKIVSGTVSCSGGRYFVSVLVQNQPVHRVDDAAGNERGEVAIHFDREHFAVVSGAVSFTGQDVEQLESMAKLRRALRRENRSLARKVAGDPHSVKSKAQRLRIEKLHCRAKRIRQDYLYKLASEVIKCNPGRIVIYPPEAKRRRGKRDIAAARMRQMFYVLGEHLQHKAKLLGIAFEIRQ